jgi:hypothetical protein
LQPKGLSEASFHKAHDWANNTGQGVEKDGEGFKAAVEFRCEYYLLEPIMGDRASVQPKHTTDTFLGGGELPDDPDDVEEDDEYSEGGDTDDINKRNDDDSGSDDDDDEETEEEEEEKEVFSRVSKGSSLTSLTPTATTPIHQTPVVHETPVRKRPVIVWKKRPPVASVATAARNNQFDENMKSNIVERQEALKLRKDAFAFKKHKLKVIEEQGKWQDKSHEHSYSRMTLWRDFKELMSQEFVPTDHQLFVINPDFKPFLDTYKDIPDDKDRPDDENKSN